MVSVVDQIRELLIELQSTNINVILAVVLVVLVVICLIIVIYQQFLLSADHPAEKGSFTYKMNPKDFERHKKQTTQK
jgi:hypothetical protein